MNVLSWWIDPSIRLHAPGIADRLGVSPGLGNRVYRQVHVAEFSRLSGILFARRRHLAWEVWRRGSGR